MFCTLWNLHPRHTSPHCVTVCDHLKCHMTGYVALQKTLSFNTFSALHTAHIVFVIWVWIQTLPPFRRERKQCCNGILTNLYVAPQSAAFQLWFKFDFIVCLQIWLDVKSWIPFSPNLLDIRSIVCRRWNRNVLTMMLLLWCCYVEAPWATLPVSPNAAVIVLGVDTGSGILHGDNRGVALFTPTVSSAFSQ